MMVLKEMMEQLVLKVLTVLKEMKEPQDHKEQQDHKVLKDQQAIQVLKVDREMLEHKVTMVLKA